MPDVLVEWERGLWSVAWSIRKGPSSVLEMPIPWPLYLQAPSHIRKWRALPRFSRIATSQRFRDAWLQECGGDERTIKRFLLQFPSGPWALPWELLIGELDRERRGSIAMVRGLPSGPSTLPSRFDRPMSVLFVQGDDGSRTGRVRLDLKREADVLLKVYDSLPAAHRQSVVKPRVCQPTSAELEGMLKEAPDVLFFSGHGSSNPSAFILVDGSQLTPARIGQLIATAPAAPLFSAFWACDTARGPKDSREAPGPPFYLALANSGVGSVLAMQAPVTDNGAILLAQEVFEALAAGDALDVAAARGRSVLLDAREMKAGDSLDWACPVVWSSGLSSARLSWNSPGSKLAQLQTASRRARLKREGRVFFPSTDEEIDAARRCAGVRLCWIKGPNLADARERWIRLLIAMQVVLPCYVVGVEFIAGQDTAESLMAWAEELQQTLELSDAPGDDFRNTLELIRHRPREGWKRLCALPDIAVSVWQPPDYRSEDWFWDPLISGVRPVSIMGEVVDGRTIAEGWAIEELDMEVNENKLNAAYSEAPVLSNALALLATPVPRSSIESTGTTLDRLANLNDLLVNTAAREVVLVASAARFFRDRMDQKTKAAAHQACMKIYADTSFVGRLTPALREQRLTHCLGAGENEAAVAEACILLAKYRELDRPLAVVALIQRLGGLWRALPENSLIMYAWACAMLGDMEQAEFWLQRSSADTPLESAWRHGLQAEIHKAAGAKTEALGEIDAAIADLRAVPQSETTPLIARRLRAYKQDRARILQYLFYRPDQAGEEYERLLDEWRDEGDAAIDVAVVLRNYSECVRTSHHPGDSEWQQSKDMLAQAETLLTDKREHPVFAELEYEKARVAIVEKRKDAPDLLKATHSAASASGHLMLVAISAARQFWEFEVFDLHRWSEIEAALSAFPRHGWAVRTLVNGRLCAAKRVGAGDIAGRLLEANLADLGNNPSFDAGSDRFRIAASAAGYSLLAPDPEAKRTWAEFLEHPWAKAWMQSGHFHTPEDVWGRVS
jgi:tetratricopeptide (TPR) repeat protein